MQWPCMTMQMIIDATIIVGTLYSLYICIVNADAACIMNLARLFSRSFLTKCQDTYQHTQAEYNRYTHSLRVKELKEEVIELSSWRRNFQNNVCEDTVENPDYFSMAEFGFWFIAKRQGNIDYKWRMIGDTFVAKISGFFQNLIPISSLTVDYYYEL